MNQATMAKSGKERALSIEEKFNNTLANLFDTDAGKIVLDRWKRTTLEKRVDFLITDTVTARKQEKPHSILFAEIGAENFVKDIVERIRRSKNP